MIHLQRQILMLACIDNLLAATGGANGGFCETVCAFLQDEAMIRCRSDMIAVLLLQQTIMIHIGVVH